MAKGTRRTRQSGLVGHLGQKGREAHAAHVDDEIISSGNLPAGIKNGIAQLTLCHFGVFAEGTRHAGEYFWYRAGSVIEPEAHEGIHTRGLFTSPRSLPLCDTPENTWEKGRKTLDDNLAYMYNEFRKLGVEPNDYKDFLAEVEETIAPALIAAGPYFRFDTFSMEDTPQYVNEVWRGVCEYEKEEVDDVVDETTEEAGLQVDPKELEGDDIPFDRAALAALADEEDEDAQAQMTELAEAAGFDLNDYLEQTWVEVDEIMTEQEAEPVGEEEEEGKEGKEKEEEKTDPEKTEVRRYKRPGAKKLAEYEVTLVTAGKKTVSLRSLDDRKLFKNVPWAKLVDVE